MNESFNNKVIMASSKGIRVMKFNRVKVNNMTTISLTRVIPGLVVRISGKGEHNKIASRLVGREIRGTVLFHSTLSDLSPQILINKYKSYKPTTWASLAKKITKDDTENMKSQKEKQSTGTDDKFMQIMDEEAANMIMNCGDLDIEEYQMYKTLARGNVLKIIKQKYEDEREEMERNRDLCGGCGECFECSDY
jgi:hypothetical protein